MREYLLANLVLSEPHSHAQTLQQLFLFLPLYKYRG